MVNLSLGGLLLTEDEAFALLGLCLTSPNKLDSASEQALKKLANFCKESCTHSYTKSPSDERRPIGA